MSRPPRIISKTGLYHIIFKGINGQDLFQKSNDYDKLLEIIADIKSEMNFELYAYCLMKNHVNLFIKEDSSGDIKKIMHKLLTRYVMWYNFKYQRSGSLIGNRYKSEPAENEESYPALIRYIHQNPIKAGVSKHLSSYAYSSYNDYINNNQDFTDVDYGLSLFSDNVELFKEYHSAVSDDDFSLSDSRKTKDDELKRRLIQITNNIQPEAIKDLDKATRNSVLYSLRQSGFTIGQLERITGISRGIITRSNVQPQWKRNNTTDGVWLL